MYLKSKLTLIFLFLALITIGFPTLYNGTKSYLNNDELKNNGIITEGIVIDKYIQPCDFPDAYDWFGIGRLFGGIMAGLPKCNVPVIQFKTNTNKIITYYDFKAKGFYVLKGLTQKLVYSKNNSKIISTDIKLSQSKSKVDILFGLFFSLGMIYLIFKEYTENN